MSPLRNLTFALLLPALLAGCEQAPAPESMGVDVKKLALKSLTGDDFKLSWRTEKPIVMNIWATWCTPCVKELPSLMELSENSDFSVLAVSIDAKPAVVKNFLKKQGFDALPVVWDKNGKQVRANLALRGVPTTYILNEDQIVVGVEQGERDWAHPDMIKKINAYLEERN